MSSPAASASATEACKSSSATSECKDPNPVESATLGNPQDSYFQIEEGRSILVNMDVLAGFGSQFQSSFTPSLQYTPWSLNTDSFPNQSEHRSQVDDVLGEDFLSPLPIDIPDFIPGVFGRTSNSTIKTQDLNTQSDGTRHRSNAVKPETYKATVPQSSSSNTTTSPPIFRETRAEGDAAQLKKHEREITKIVNKRKTRLGMEYMVRWEDTWLPEGRLGNVRGLLREFEAHGQARHGCETS